MSILLRVSCLAAIAFAAPSLAARVEPAAHDYLRGRYADADNRLDDAARYYGTALRADPGNPVLQRRTFDTAVAAGDEALALRLARDLETAKAGDAATSLVRLADALKRRDWVAAAGVRGLPDTGYAAAVGAIVEGWISFGRGDVAGALVLVDPAKGTGIARSYLVEHRAMLLAAAHRDAEASPLFANMLDGEAKSVVRVRIAAAASLAAQRRNAEATAVLAAGGSDPALGAAAKRLAAGRMIEPGPLDPRQGVALLLTRLAGDLSHEKPVPLALTFARVATFLAPETGETWLVAGDVLLRSGRASAALAAYYRIPPRDWMAALAPAHRGAALSALGRDDEARALFTASAAAPTASADDWQQLGDLERKLDHQAAAAMAYDHAITVAGGDADWSLYFLRGAAFEQAGDWGRGEADLRAALGRAPGEPTVLNYLGYALLDRGQKLPEATALIAAAAKLRPNDGFIADSLGWAFYRGGDFARAVAALEGAARLEPGDATINDHLGDAYWRVGRHLEARFQWRTAAALDPAPAAAAVLVKKLDFGLDVATAAVADASVPPAKP